MDFFFLFFEMESRLDEAMLGLESVGVELYNLKREMRGDIRLLLRFLCFLVIYGRVLLGHVDCIFVNV